MKTLYEHIGEENLLKLVHEFYNRVFSSEIIGPLFQNNQKDYVYILNEIQNKISG